MRFFEGSRLVYVPAGESPADAMAAPDRLEGKLAAKISAAQAGILGHVNTIKHADRVLQGMAGWELPEPEDTRAIASKAAETHDKGKRGQRHRSR